MTARVTWWNYDRGHGFARTDGGEDIFVHHAAVEGGVDLHPEQRVEFDPIAGTVGTVAANVRVLP